MRKEFSKNALGSFALYASSKLLMFLASVLLARLLGADGYGVYAFAMATILLIGVPVSLGLPTLVVRLVASYRVQERWDLMRGLLVRSNQTLLVIAVTSSLLVAVVVWLWADQLGPTKSAALWWATALLPIGALGAVRSGALRGLSHVVLGQLPESLILPLALLLGLVCWDVLGNLTAPAAMAIRVIAGLLAFLVGWWLLMKHLPREQRRAKPQYDTHRWACSAFPLMLAAFMTAVMTQTDVLLLAAFRGTESAGIFQAAARGGELVALSMVVINFALQPALARLYATENLLRLQELTQTAARLAFAASLPIAICLCLFADVVMRYAFGSDFERGAFSLIVLCVAQVFTAAIGPAREILTMTGHEKNAAIAMAVGAIANVALNATLIPVWDIEGAAIGTALSLIVWNTTLTITVRHQLGIDSSVLGRSIKRASRVTTTSPVMRDSGVDAA